MYAEMRNVFHENIERRWMGFGNDVGMVWVSKQTKRLYTGLSRNEPIHGTMPEWNYTRDYAGMNLHTGLSRNELIHGTKPE